MRSSSDLLLWVLSAAGGAVGVLTFFALGTPALVLILPLLVAWMWSGVRRRSKAGGVLVGVGVAALATMALANARCAEFSARPGQSCIPPDLTFGVVASVVLLGVGMALTLRARPVHAT